MMLRSLIIRKWAGGYKLAKSQEKINHPMYMDDIKLFTKNEKALETLLQAVRIYSHDIGMESGKEKCAILIMRNRKRHMTGGICWHEKRKSNTSKTNKSKKINQKVVEKERRLKRCRDRIKQYRQIKKKSKR